MNYLKIYNKICRNAIGRDNGNYYTERHHIFPQGLFGANKRIVRLTAKEHFICHFLLFKFCKKRYGIDHWKTRKMGYAFYKMTISSKNQQRYTSKSYGIIKEWYSKNNPSFFNREKMLGNKFGALRKNTKHSEETKQKISIANKGKLVGDLNPAKRPEVREKISKTNSDGRTAHYGASHKNYKHNLTTEIRQSLKEEWNKEKAAGRSLYSFAREKAKEYDCSQGCIQGIVYISPNLQK